MTLTILYYDKTTQEPINQQLRGRNAQECMTAYHMLQWTHDLAKYTPARIVDVQDD